MDAEPLDPTALPTSDDVMAVLRGVIDPELGSDIVDLGMARGAGVGADGAVVVTIALTTAGCPLRAQIQQDVRARVGSLPGVTSVRLAWTEMTDEQRTTAMGKARFNVSQRPEETSVPLAAKVILIASGKGGVGKSSVTVNLAAALAAQGLTVGVLDADIWGFSVPRMLGVEGRLAGVAHEGRKQMTPIERRIGDGVVRVVSMGLLVYVEETALIHILRGELCGRGAQPSPGNFSDEDDDSRMRFGRGNECVQPVRQTDTGPDERHSGASGGACVPVGHADRAVLVMSLEDRDIPRRQFRHELDDVPAHVSEDFTNPLSGQRFRDCLSPSHRYPMTLHGTLGTLLPLR